MLTAWNVSNLDRIFDSFFQEVGGPRLLRNGNQHFYSPAIDVRESEEAILFVCDVPGLKGEDLEVTLENQVLTIQGERRVEQVDGDRVFGARRHGAFSRSFTLPEVVDTEKITADLSHGVLTIRVPKQPRARARKIEVRTSGEPLQLT